MTTYRKLSTILDKLADIDRAKLSAEDQTLLDTGEVALTLLEQRLSGEPVDSELAEHARCIGLAA